MDFKKFDLKTWLFPTICFFLFCYGMAFIIIYTYASNTDVSLFGNVKTPAGTTDAVKFREEMMKQIKKIN
ncbi:hypothetical protein BKH41_01315 [Helicobacter sp. 12S02232-10]|uniref:hypothetical protein n=1 Tax=Helicobacter sp. 12S02232-10 TaxID=1476197 RepID=UPI000BA6D2A0|nr:hypothetical protein [Helicobacter sp. 12S02232-10]PAF49965.1 hypothetical protein BKH41_01315 [Helicobacter sp. 12S02232-10]